jgi:hypothetical protein
MKYENFWENLKIHAGGDDKLRIQFASPNVYNSNSAPEHAMNIIQRPADTA